MVLLMEKKPADFSQKTFQRASACICLRRCSRSAMFAWVHYMNDAVLDAHIDHVESVASLQVFQLEGPPFLGLQLQVRRQFPRMQGVHAQNGDHGCASRSAYRPGTFTRSR